MNDCHIRSALKQKLSKQYAKDSHTSMIEELGLCHGEVRIDIAVVNGFLHGYELKSDKDTLERLVNQARIYNLIFDRITLVVGCKHAYEAIKLIPEWWGVRIAEQNLQKNICFHNIRSEGTNPSLDALSIAKLLWRSEALNLLDKTNSANGVRSKVKAVIYKRIVEKVDLETIRAEVRKQLRTRKNWRFDVQQKSNGD